MGKENEDYLDQLLNAVQNSGIPQDPTVGEADIEVEKENPFLEMESAVESSDSGSRGRRERKSRFGKQKRKKSEEDFLDEFEKELADFDSEKFISDYELELDVGNEQGEASAEETSFSFEGLGAAMTGVGEKVDSAELNEEVKVAEPGEEESVGDFDVEESKAEDGIDNVLINGQSNVETNEEINDGNDDLLSGVSSLLDSTIEDPSQSEEAKEAEKDSAEVDINSDEDIMSMLDGFGDDQDLSDIGDMLKADENHESILGDQEVTTESVAESLADLGFEIDPGDADELASLKDVSADVSTTQEEGKTKKKGGFLAKLKNLFFGPDEEEMKPEQEIKIPEADLSGISAENLDILRSLEGSTAGEQEESIDPKAKKKAEKAEKKKEAEKKKAEKAKAKEAAKKAKEAAKKAKPKKEKKPKVKDNTPPLPKLPVFLVFVMAASIVVAVLFLGNGMHYRQSIKRSEDFFAQGSYMEAYNEVSGLSLKEGDEKFVEKVQMLAAMDELNRSYDTLIKADRQELALDCLIRMIGHFEANMSEANELDCIAELSAYEERAEKILKKEYKVSYDKANKIYKLRSRTKYSIQLVTILEKVGKN